MYLNTLASYVASCLESKHHYGNILDTPIYGK